MKAVSIPPEALPVWQGLFKAVDDFKALRPWEWMTDRHLFGIQDPKSGIVGYCSIMGHARDLYGLDVLLGTDGLEVFLDRMEAPPEISPEDSILDWKSLRLSFENKRTLSREDMDLLNAVGLKFKGAGQWPLFRSFRPTYFPWFLTLPEARFLTLALEQTCAFSSRHRQSPDDIRMPPGVEKYLCLIPEKRENGLFFREEWREPDTLSVPKEVSLRLEESRVRRINLMPFLKTGWEMDLLTLPNPFQDSPEARPYFPNLLIAADPQDGRCAGQEVLANLGYEQALAERFLSLMEKSEGRPAFLRLHEEANWDFLAPLFDRLSLPMERCANLPAVDEIYAYLENNLGDLYSV
ncbi:MAG: hypothetical protein A2293_02190 [Elusimicrobia bacterium RIFOXYB2_FULL_49_7]|nr:MAG: hypothetical protein A2293_02190 [Elusimicrobia bacterium RIFOXYB2_FULL_49_7]